MQNVYIMSIHWDYIDILYMRILVICMEADRILAQKYFNTTHLDVLIEKSVCCFQLLFSFSYFVFELLISITSLLNNDSRLKFLLIICFRNAKCSVLNFLHINIINFSDNVYFYIDICIFIWFLFVITKLYIFWSDSSDFQRDI